MLTRISLNPIQFWALQYWVYMDRRTQIDDTQAELEHQCFNLFPDRWSDLYRVQSAPSGDIGNAFGDEPEMMITNADELDRWFEGVTARQGDAALGTANGPGRRV